MAATTLHTDTALGIVLELMDLIGQQVTLTRRVTEWRHHDEDGGLLVVPVHEVVSGELYDVRAAFPGRHVISVVLITGEDERVCHTHEVLLHGERTGPVSDATFYAVAVNG